MRRAFVGLSAPLGFDYRHIAPAGPGDTLSSPNPILDSPFGLLLLFDEILFLTRHLCPKNMRDLSYVRFIDEEGMVPQIGDLDFGHLSTILEHDHEWSRRLALNRANVPGFQEALRNAGVYWTEGGIDNHSQGLSIKEVTRQANADAYNLLFDLLILERLNDPSIELASNSRMSWYLDPTPSSVTHPRLIELIILRGIPNYLTIDGPYHPVIEEVRGDPFLKDYRKWVSFQATSPDPREMAEIQKGAESAIRRSQDEVFLKYLDPKGLYFSVGKAAIGDAIGVLVPGSGVAMTLLEEGLDAKHKKSLRWQGFVVRARAKLHGTD
jgi:hypothetical protein